jgi:hypothetical protein
MKCVNQLLILSLFLIIIKKLVTYCGTLTLASTAPIIKLMIERTTIAKHNSLKAMRGWIFHFFFVFGFSSYIYIKSKIQRVTRMRLYTTSKSQTSS